MKKKMNNKGFSLVELIVVVAIMAVLIGVLAPQYLRYVEKSRLQKDNSAIAEIANAMKIAAADEAINTFIAGDAAGKNVTIANTADNNATITFGTGDVLMTELGKAIAASYTTGSNSYKKSDVDIVLNVKVDGNGVVTVTGTGIIDTPNGSAGSKTF